MAADIEREARSLSYPQDRPILFGRICRSGCVRNAESQRSSCTIRKAGGPDWSFRRRSLRSLLENGAGSCDPRLGFLGREETARLPQSGCCNSGLRSGACAGGPTSSGEPGAVLCDIRSQLEALEGGRDAPRHHHGDEPRCRERRVSPDTLPLRGSAGRAVDLSRKPSACERGARGERRRLGDGIAARERVSERCDLGHRTLGRDWITLSPCP